MFKVQISSGPVGMIREMVQVATDGHSARTVKRFVPGRKSYLTGWERTDVRLQAETFETHAAARAAISQAREDGTIGHDERTVILCDD